MKRYAGSLWSQHDKAVKHVNPELSAILEMTIRDQGLSDKSLIIKELSFGDMILSKGILPSDDFTTSQKFAFGLVLENSLEVFTHEKDGDIPIAILEPGQSFVLQDYSDLSLLPLSLLNICAGARSIFLLPKISEETRFWKLARIYGLKDKTPPTNLNEHWQMFVDLARKAETSWKATVLLFDKSWLDLTSIAGYRLYQYLKDTNSPNPHFFRKKLIFEMAFNEALNELRFKPDPFLINTIMQLFAICCHFTPGFVFAEDESLAPVELLQTAFMDHYGIHYTPSILQPGYAKKGQRCYHSLQHPMLNDNSSRKHDTNLVQIREIHRALSKTIEHIQRLDPINDELIDFLNTELEFFHLNAQKQHREVASIKKMEVADPIIQRQISKFRFPFSDTSSFLRKGCIAMSLPQTAS